MLKLALISLLLCYETSWAQGFKITPTSQDVDTSLIPPHQLSRPSSRKKIHYLSPISRDKVLDRYFKAEIKDWNESDRDIFYKSLLNYDAKRLFIKYPFLKKADLKKVKNALQ